MHLSAVGSGAGAPAGTGTSTGEVGVGAGAVLSQREAGLAATGLVRSEFAFLAGERAGAVLLGGLWDLLLGGLRECLLLGDSRIVAFWRLGCGASEPPARLFRFSIVLFLAILRLVRSVWRLSRVLSCKGDS